MSNKLFSVFRLQTYRVSFVFWRTKLTIEWDADCFFYLSAFIHERVFKTLKFTILYLFAYPQRQLWKISPVQYGVLYNFERVYLFRNCLVPLVLAAGVKTCLWLYHVSAIGRHCLGNGYPGNRLIIIGFRSEMVRIPREVQWRYREEKSWAQW